MYINWNTKFCNAIRRFTRNALSYIQIGAAYTQADIAGIVLLVFGCAFIFIGAMVIAACRQYYHLPRPIRNYNPPVEVVQQPPMTSVTTTTTTMGSPVVIDQISINSPQPNLIEMQPIGGIQQQPQLQLPPQQQQVMVNPNQVTIMGGGNPSLITTNPLMNNNYNNNNNNVIVDPNQGNPPINPLMNNNYNTDPSVNIISNNPQPELDQGGKSTIQIPSQPEFDQDGKIILNSPPPQTSNAWTN